MEFALVSPLGRTVLGAAKVTIGRALDNTLVLNDVKVAAYHAEIRPEISCYSLASLSNEYETFINGQLIYSGTLRTLQPNDMLRIGNTMFTFTMSNGAQQASSAQYPAMAPTVPDLLPPDPPTNYGAMGNYGGNPSYFNAQVPTYISPYEPQAQQSGYAPNYNGPQSPTPVPPANYALNPSGPQPPVPPSRRRPSMVMIVSAAIAVLLIIAGIVGFSVYHGNKVALDNTHATATAVQTLSRNHATATVVAQQNTTATAVAGVGLTATAIATSPYPPFTKLVLNDALTTTAHSWNASATCQVSATGYQVSVTQANIIQECMNGAVQYGEMAYQAMMTIHTGDCGGLIFRYSDNNNFFFFEVCQDGTYNLEDYVNSKSNALYSSFKGSSAIQTGLDAQNLMAVVLQGNTINMYVNNSHIDTATDSNLMGTTLSQGYIGLLADDSPNPTSVMYTNAIVWTM